MPRRVCNLRFRATKAKSAVTHRIAVLMALR